MVEFTRQKNESFEAFLRRFNRGVKNSKKCIKDRRRTNNSKRRKP
jgi:predicted RNA-binding protein with RPS1 domain